MQRRAFLETMGLSATTLFTRPFVSGRWFAGRTRAETEILIYGAGTGGFCAGVQAARMGVPVTLVEPTVWVGGMLTAAGVSALDGNQYGAGGGMVQEFRDGLIAHYGSEEAINLNWVSRYSYEPHIGHQVLQAMAAPLDHLTLFYETEVTGYEKAGPKERLIRLRNTAGDTTEIACRIFIDATEYGDGLALAGIPYRLGREGRDELGESAAPPVPDLEMQEMTYTATLVKRSGAAPMPVTDADRAYWSRFACSTRENCPNPDPILLNHTIHPWGSFLSYAMLPNDKYLLNWPHHANDYPVNTAFFEDRSYRERHLAGARMHTIAFIKYLQTALGHPEWQLAEDEYPTDDHLPLIPYIRESRRLVNDRIMVQDDVVPRGGAPRAPVIDHAIAVGDYYIDHHHAKDHLPPEERLGEAYPDNAPFQIPITVFFPDHGDERFLVGEKSIAVSHLVNGCTRLQPPVMLMGQALGVIAALAVRQSTVPASVDVRRVQQQLIQAGCPLYLVYDVAAGEPLFEPVQQLALQGVLQAGDPTHLAPEAPILAEVAHTWASRLGFSVLRDPVLGQPLAREHFTTAFRGRLPDGEGPVTRGVFLQALYEEYTSQQGLR